MAFQIDNGRVVWESKPVNMTADQLLAAEARASKGETQVDRAAEFLLNTLANGPMSATEVLDAGVAEGFAKATLNRAKTKANVRSVRSGFGAEGTWSWSLSPNPPAFDEDPRPENLHTYGAYGGEALAA